VVLTEKNNDLISIRGKLPFSAQRKSEKQFLSIYRSHVDGDLGLPEAKNEIERILIQSALERSHNNVTLTANNLGIKRSTLYSIFNRLDMKRQTDDN
jgi:DNA-binding NtrC family response regulator